MLDELSSDDDGTLSEREVDMVIIPTKVDVLTYNENINGKELCTSPNIPADEAGEIENPQSSECNSNSTE